mmetsp:Transcript_54172/g.86124  ORF Transcript_54172/g.86124 Transcript_54172/m.86124 type:complete len:257 (+) Transcript_54172:85-855(+)
MPPKKAPEPLPEPVVEVPTGPTPVLVDGIQVPLSWLKQLKNIDTDASHRHMKERSADLRSDPKMRAVQSISDIRRNASLPAMGPRESERMHAREAQAKHLRRLHDEAMGRCTPCIIEIPQHVSEETRRLFRKKSNEDADPMRESMRRKAPLLLTNLELAQSDMLKRSSPILRCTTLDRVHGWYDKHRTKDPNSSPKRSQGPAYLKFGKDEPTMSGSLRAEPNERRYAPLPWDQLPSQKPAWLVNGMRKASSEAYLG